MSIQHVVSKAPTELHAVVIWHKIRIMKFTNIDEKRCNLYILNWKRNYPSFFTSVLFVMKSALCYNL